MNKRQWLSQAGFCFGFSNLEFNLYYKEKNKLIMRENEVFEIFSFFIKIQWIGIVAANKYSEMSKK